MRSRPRRSGPSRRRTASSALPYRKYMNSNNDVDMAAAVIMCTAEAAQRLGVAARSMDLPACRHRLPRASLRLAPRHLQPHAGRRARRARACSTSPGSASTTSRSIDLYSCFPSAVQLGAASLGLGLDRQLTRTGGLAFAGGPWNNYVMHAIATVVGELREQAGERALVWANGGYVTKHSFGVYGTEPPTNGFRHDDPQDEIDALPRPATGDHRGGRRTGDDRGLHGHARARRRARAGDHPRASSTMGAERGGFRTTRRHGRPRRR